jgi:hypothetical protein
MLSGMKSGIFIALFCGFAPFVVLAAEDTADAPVNPTAYTAMRLVQKQIGGDALSRIVEIVGHDGTPQPFLWKVILKEGAGVREVDVTGGRIAAQRVVISQTTAALPPIKLHDLNLDSSGAFDAADAQARKARVRFDSLNYTLKASEVTGKPLWTLDLLDKDGASMGTMRLAAHDGATLNVEGRLARIAGPAESPARETGGGPANSTTTTETTTVVQSEEDDESIGFFTRAGRTIDKTNRTVQRHLRKAGSTVQRFFTGHGDSDQPDE